MYLLYALANLLRGNTIRCEHRNIYRKPPSTIKEEHD